MGSNRTFNALVASISGGKIHRLANPNTPREGAWRPCQSLCGRTITPLNYFDTVADALAYCGGRSEYLCRQCGFTEEDR